ncbi:hypothetical protein ACOKFD_04745 [Flagellimonas sp. S174]
MSNLQYRSQLTNTTAQTQGSCPADGPERIGLGCHCFPDRGHFGTGARLG